MRFPDRATDFGSKQRRVGYADGGAVLPPKRRVGYAAGGPIELDPKGTVSSVGGIRVSQAGDQTPYHGGGTQLVAQERSKRGISPKRVGYAEGGEVQPEVHVTGDTLAGQVEQRFEQALETDDKQRRNYDDGGYVDEGDGGAAAAAAAAEEAERQRQAEIAAEAERQAQAQAAAAAEQEAQAAAAERAANNVTAEPPAQQAEAPVEPQAEPQATAAPPPEAVPQRAEAPLSDMGPAPEGTSQIEPTLQPTGYAEQTGEEPSALSKVLDWGRKQFDMSAAAAEVPGGGRTGQDVGVSPVPTASAGAPPAQTGYSPRPIETSPATADESIFSLAGKAIAKPFQDAFKEDPYRDTSQDRKSIWEVPGEIRKGLTSYLKGDGADPPDVMLQRIQQANPGQPSGNLNADVQKTFDALVQDNKIQDAFSFSQALRQDYDKVRSFGQAAIDRGRPDVAARAADEMHNRLPNNMTMKTTVTPDGNFNVRLTPEKSGMGQGKEYNLSPQQFRDFLVGPASQFDHAADNRIDNNLDVLTRQRPPGTQPGGAPAPVAAAVPGAPAANIGAIPGGELGPATGGPAAVPGAGSVLGPPQDRAAAPPIQYTSPYPAFAGDIKELGVEGAVRKYIGDLPVTPQRIQDAMIRMRITPVDRTGQTNTSTVPSYGPSNAPVGTPIAPTYGPTTQEPRSRLELPGPNIPSSVSRADAEGRFTDRVGGQMVRGVDTVNPNAQPPMFQRPVVERAPTRGGTAPLTGFDRGPAMEQPRAPSAEDRVRALQTRPAQAPEDSVAAAQQRMFRPTDPANVERGRQFEQRVSPGYREDPMRAVPPARTGPYDLGGGAGGPPATGGANAPVDFAAPPPAAPWRPTYGPGMTGRPPPPDDMSPDARAARIFPNAGQSAQRQQAAIAFANQDRAEQAKRDEQGSQERRTAATGESRVGAAAVTGASRERAAQTTAASRETPEQRRLRELEVQGNRNAGALERTQAVQQGAGERRTAQDTAAMARTQEQQTGATQRTGMQQQGAGERRTAQDTAAMQRTERQQQGAGERRTAQDEASAQRQQARDQEMTARSDRVLEQRDRHLAYLNNKAVNDRIQRDFSGEMQEVMKTVRTKLSQGIKLTEDEMENYQIVLDSGVQRTGRRYGEPVTAAPVTGGAPAAAGQAANAPVAPQAGMTASPVGDGTYQLRDGTRVRWDGQGYRRVQ